MYHSKIAVLYLVLAVVRGTNFPPIENSVPIPGLGVKAPLQLQQSGLYFSGVNPDYSRENPDNSRRWIQDSGFSYLPPDFSQETFQPPLEDFGKLYETALPSIGPVATPPPDGIADASNRQGVVPQFSTGTVVLSPSNFWMRGKSNPYPVQQIIPVPPMVARTIEIKELQQPIGVPITSSKSPNVISTRVTNAPFPVQEIRVNDPRVYHSFRALIDDLPKPKDTKQIQVETPPASQLEKSPVIPVSVFPQFTNKNSNIDLPPSLPSPNIPPGDIDSRLGLPIFPVASPKNLLDTAIVGWIVNADGQLSPVRRMVMPPRIAQPSIVFNPESPARVILSATNGKSMSEIPARVAIDNTWVLRQGATGPYFERLRSLLPTRNMVTGKSPVTEMVVDPVNYRSTVEFLSPKFSAPIVYRRGNEPQPVTNMRIVGGFPIPHSPKSDILVIGKGNTLAHLAPQMSNIPAPTVKVPTEPCPTPINQKTPTVVPPAIIRPLPNIVPVSRKTLPNVSPFQVDRPYPYYIWNAKNEPLVPSLPLQRSVFDSSSSTVPKNNFYSPNSMIRNRFQNPYRYLPPYNIPNIVDLQGRKPVGVEVIPPPLPEVDASAPSESPQQSTETGSGSVSMESSSETIPKPTLGGEAIEAEAAIVDRLQAQASQVSPSYIAPSIQSTIAKDKSTNKKPPHVDLKERDDSGIILYRQEGSDTNDKVVGKEAQIDPKTATKTDSKTLTDGPKSVL